VNHGPGRASSSSRAPSAKSGPQLWKRWPHPSPVRASKCSWHPPFRDRGPDPIPGEAKQEIVGEERPDPRRHGARTEPDGAGGERSPRIEMDRQDPDPAAVRQVREPAPELLDLPAPRPRSLGKHEDAVALVQIPRGPVQRFAERAAALHRDEVGEVAEEGALHPVVEEVVGGGQGQQVPSRFPERHLHEPHVEMGAVIRHHQVVRVVRNVRPAREGRLQHLVVEPVLDLGQRRPPGLGHRGRNLDLFLVALLPGLAAARTATPDAALGRPAQRRRAERIHGRFRHHSRDSVRAAG